MADRYKLSSTSALVLLWTDETTYPCEKSRKYLEQLDLSCGREVFNQCRDIWPDYGEVIRNRKYCIHNVLFNEIKSKPHPQVIIFGAGMCPLSLEILDRFSDVKIFDVELCPNPAKEKIMSGLLNPGQCIRYLHEDIANTEALYNKLQNAGYNPEMNTIIVLEGVSYYVCKDRLWNTLAAFKKSKIIFEYLVTDEQIDPERRHIPNAAFKAVADDCCLKDIKRYNIDELTQPPTPSTLNPNTASPCTTSNTPASATIPFSQSLTVGGLRYA
ncbi:MAG: class I SAM-dependent methyltransferase [Oligoflexia bacterium]|nr:class I SAM-dependent methyltransferase [Oligoflexia bacterium]